MESAKNIEMRKLKTLKLNPDNPRRHPKDQIARIAASIKTYGFNNPILIRADGQIIAGHGRYKAAKLLKIADVPTVTLDHLSPELAQAYLMADNKTQEGAKWDDDLVARNLMQLHEAEMDLLATGYNNDELDAILTDMSGFQKPDLTDAEGKDKKDKKPDGDGNWLYVEFYGMDDEYKDLLVRMEPFMQSAHEIRRDHFIEMVEVWLATKE